MSWSVRWSRTGAAILLAALVAASGCRAGTTTTSLGESQGSVSSGVTDSPPPTEQPVGEAVGPLANLQWTGGEVPVGALLHDDGTTLWSVSIDGDWTALWRHPLVNPLFVAAGPDGRGIALSVLVSTEAADEISAVLYFLEVDGEVRTVDAVDDYGSIESPIFLRPPTDPTSEPLLYWIRFWGDVSPETGRLHTEVMVETQDGPAEVLVPLRYHEAVFALAAYPGAATFSLTLIRQNNVPTRLEVLQNEDYWRSAQDSSLLLWTDIETRANTDAFTGVAWLTPQRYVIPVGRDPLEEGYSLRLFESGCEYLGSHISYEGNAPGVGYSEFPWPLLAAGPDRVLLISAADERRLGDGASRVPWTALDTVTGELTAVGAEWEPGAWSWVEPLDDTNPSEEPPDCSMWDWTYP
jgi:hypothetical protein